MGTTPWSVDRFAERKAMEDPAMSADHSGLMLANFTTLAHFSMSSAMNLPNSGGRSCKRRVAKVCNPRLHRGIGKNGIDLLVEFLDDIGRCIHWRADTQPRARVVPRQKIAQRWDVGQRRRARCRCHRQRPQLAGSDKFDRRSKGIEYNLDPAAN